MLCRRRGDDINWDETLAWARTLGWEAALHLALSECVAKFETPLPDTAQRWLQQDRRYLSGATTVARLASPAVTRSLDLFEKLRDMSVERRLRYLLQLLFPHPSYIRSRYRSVHPLLLPFAYVYRWLDIGIDIVRTIVRGARGRFSPRGLMKPAGR